MIKETTRVALAAFLLTVFVLYSVCPAVAQEGEQGSEGGSPVRLVMTVAAIWLAIMAAVVIVVVVTRRRGGEEERKSKEL